MILIAETERLYDLQVVDASQLPNVGIVRGVSTSISFFYKKMTFFSKTPKPGTKILENRYCGDLQCIVPRRPEMN